MRAWPLAALLIAQHALAQGLPQNRLPTADPQKRQQFTLLNADDARFLDDDVELSGHVHAQYKGYDIFADKVSGNRQTKIFRLEGNARLVGKGSDVFGDVIVVDFDAETFRFEDGRARLSPEALKGEAKEDVFLTSTSGSGTVGLYNVAGGLFTTCDKPDPHFRITSRSTRVRPGRNVVLRDARLDVLGHTIFGFPYLVIPLIEDGRRYLPDTGQSPTEGYYVKTRFSTPIKGDDYFDTRLDYMSRLGTGVGVDLNYDHNDIDGRFEAYTVIGRQKGSTVSSRHRQALGAGQFIFDARYQQRNHLTAPQTTQVNTRAQYVMPWAQGTSRMSWFRVGNDRPNFSSVTQSLALNDSHRWDGTYSTRLDLNLSRAESRPSVGAGTTSQRLDVRFTGRGEFRTFAADLMYQRSMPVGDSTGFFSATDRTPMLSLKTDARRLLGPAAARSLPFRSELSIGELADPASGGNITRTNFDFVLNRTESKGRSSLQWNGRYNQGLYSNDTAQYVLDYGARWTYRFGDRSSFNMGYRNHRAFGFTPLSIDRTGRNDAFNLDVAWQAARTLQLTARTGYDILQSDRGNTPWRQLWLRSEWTPARSFQLRTSNVYDTFGQVWSSSRIDASYIEGDFRLGIGARYDGRRSVWGSANLIMQGLKVGRTTFAVAWNWNGFRERFDAQHYSLVYDLHAAEAVLDIIDNQSGFRSGRTIALFLRLKAFPTRSAFGSGTRGQAIGAQSGFGF